MANFDPKTGPSDILPGQSASAPKAATVPPGFSPVKNEASTPASSYTPLTNFHPLRPVSPPVSSSPTGESASVENNPPVSPPPGVVTTSAWSSLKRLLIFLLILIFLGGLGFGIWKFVLPVLPASMRPGGVNLTYWGLWEDEKVVQSIITDFEKSHRGVKIVYKKQSPKEYRERLQAALVRSDGPDLFRFHNTWLPMLKTGLSPVPSNVYSANDFQKIFYPVATRDLKMGNNYYGIPLEVDGLALLYNEEIFKEASLPPPANWLDLQKAAYLLTVKDQQGRIKTAGAALGLTANIDGWSDILALMLLQNGVDLKNPQGKLAEDALTFYTSFAQGDNKVWDEILPASTEAFAAGKVAMIFAPSWQILKIKAINPDLKFKVLPVPQLPGSNITWASYWAEGVSAKSSHQKEAWEFLKYLSQKDTMVKFYTEIAKTRTFGEPYSRQDLASSLENDPYIWPYIKQASDAQSFYFSSQTFDNGINDKGIKYLEDAVNSVNRGVSPKSALETAAKGVKQILSTYNVAAQ